MPRKSKSNGTDTLEPIEEPTSTSEEPSLDPIAEVIEQMPEPSSFADTISNPIGDENLSGDRADNQTETVTDNSGGNGEFTFETPQSKPIESETFDPNIHCVDENGNPRLTPTGKFRRRRGKKAAQPTPDILNPDPVRMANAKAAAQVSVAATILAGQMCFGAEAGAPVQGEAEQMNEAYTQFYFLSEKPIELKPWLLVLMVCSQYAGRRMAMEEPRNRVMRGVDWIAGKFKSVWDWGSSWGKKKGGGFNQ